MKILYDHQIFSSQKYGGISRYFFELINSYDKNQDLQWDISLKYSENAYLQNSKLSLNIEKGESTEDLFLGIDFKGKAKIHRTLTKIGLAKHPMILNKHFSIEKISQGSFDLLHPTYYDPYFLKHLNSKPFVLTIYDMNHELYSGIYFKKNNSTVKSKRFLAERAEKIIAISGNTKKDIINLYGIDDKKIDVVYLGSSLVYQDEDLPNTKLNKNFILFVGDRHTYKNFKFFLKSISPLIKDGNDLMLICAGSKPFDNSEIKLLQKLKLEKTVSHKPIINDSSLSQLYRKALCFVFPTLYEGFGIPVLEAFSCGCPAVISNTSSLPEVGGDAALYFDPQDADSILQAVKQVVYNKTLADEMRKKGSNQLKNFSWQKCALETKKVYEGILDK